MWPLPLGAAGYAVVLADASGGFLPPVVHAVAGGAHRRGFRPTSTGTGTSIC